MKRDFNKWLETFRSSICDYKFYVDFEKVYGKVDNIKVELNILNSLIGSKNIENDFKNLVAEYPKVLKCIPILLAVRSREIYAIDSDGEYLFNFAKQNYSIDEYIMFMRKTGLFSLISEHLINNLVDYVTGVEVGLDSNGRKNRGGHLMEDLVESHFIKAGLVKGIDYFKRSSGHQQELFGNSARLRIFVSRSVYTRVQRGVRRQSERIQNASDSRRFAHRYQTF